MEKYLSMDELNDVFRQLGSQYKIMAPAYEHFGGRFAHTDNLLYQEVKSAEQIVWKKKSHFSPKEVVLPITETLFYFNGDELRESRIDPRPTLLFLRSCDIHALERLDHMYLKNGGNADYYYEMKRKKLKLILLECSSSFENCFCVSMGTNQTDNYDAAVRFSDDGLHIQINDNSLKPLFETVGKETDYQPQFVQSNPTTVRTPDQVCDDPNLIRQILQNDPSWAQYDSRCIGCGRCTTSCPTCSCHSVFDVAYDENPTQGERRRQQASCMTGDFTNMAGGHKFREKTGERLRYRALHKVNDYKAREGTNHMCVGCGRCDDRCPQYISFTTIVNRMTDIVEQHLIDRQKEKADV
ncbi:anaerobic sulfite reductase subunit A [Photobacterium leiognathi subsp. mandapamensis]|nr:anaerobic sulfite reductase subunit A [Photobacterium leiognathi subsp. mandapamensis]